MVTFEQALKNILNNARVLSIEKVVIEDSVGRILQEDIYSGLEMPPFDKSAMDGYAVCCLDTQDAYAKLECIGIIQAGESFNGRLKRGECVQIMTGAPMPKGADSVVMIEDTKEARSANRNEGYFVRILKKVKTGENVCLRGEDIKKGQKLFRKGERIFSPDTAVLAAMGRRFVKVIRPPTVAILNTGGEIVPVGTKLCKNKIYNSNGPMLEALHRFDGILPVSLGIVKDNVRQLERALRQGLKADILLISGGVSMGAYDLIPAALRNIKVKEVFHKVNIKPGKPLFFGVKNKTLIFGVPGNPVSNFLAYFVFIRPAIYKMMGLKPSGAAFKDGILVKEFRKKTDRRQFVLVKVLKRGNYYYLSVLDSHGSADILSLSKADGFMMVNENKSVIKKNTKMRFITWKEL